MAKPNAPLKYDAFATTPVAFMEAMIKNALHSLQTCIPAIVKSTTENRTVIATPAISKTSPAWEEIPWADIELPIWAPFGGDIGVAFPIKAGDTGWIIAGDLDPSLFFKDPQKPAKQNVYDRHDYRFGFFIPATFGEYTMASDDGALVIGTRDGKTKISIKSGEITIASESELNINAEIVKINGSNNVTINGTDWKTHNHTVPSGAAVQVSPTSGTGTVTGMAITGGVN